MAAIVMVGQKICENRLIFAQLSKIRLKPQRLNESNILFPVPVRHKGVIFIKFLIAWTGVFWAFPAKRKVAVLNGTLGNRTVLVARATSTAGTIAAQMHDAQPAVQPAQGKKRLLANESFHLMTSLEPQGLFISENWDVALRIRIVAVYVAPKLL